MLLGSWSFSPLGKLNGDATFWENGFTSFGVIIRNDVGEVFSATVYQVKGNKDVTIAEAK